MNAKQRCKLVKVNEALFRSPFRTIGKSEKGRLVFKFYDRRGWDCGDREPDWEEVVGTTIQGQLCALLFTKGIVLGYAQRVILVRKNHLEVGE